MAKTKPIGQFGEKALQRATNSLNRANRAIAGNPTVLRKVGAVGGRLLGPAATAYGIYADYQEGAESGDRVRGAVSVFGGLGGGALGGALGSSVGPGGTLLGGAVGAGAGSKAATKAYDFFFPAKQNKAQTGVSGLSGLATNALASMPENRSAAPKTKKTTKTQPAAAAGGWRFNADSPELAMGEMQYRLGQQALGNQGRLGRQNLDVERTLGLGEQYTQRAIAGTMANRDIVTNRDQVRGAVDMTRLNTGRDIAVTRLNTNRDIAVTGLTTNRDIITNRDQVRGAVDMTRLNTGRDIAVTGISERGATDRTRLTTEAQKYIGGSGNMRTRSLEKVALGDQFTQRYIGGSGDKRTQAQIEIAKIQAGGQIGAINASRAGQASLLDTQMRASQAEAMRNRNDQMQMQREMLDYQRRRDQQQMNLQQFGLIASLYG